MATTRLLIPLVSSVLDWRAMASLNKRQALFCRYFVDSGLNATRAAIQAGYSPKTATVQASRLLTLVKIQAHIERLYAQRMRRSEVTAEAVLQGLSAVAFSDIRELVGTDGNIQKLADLSPEAQASIASFDLTAQADGSTGLSRVRLADRVRALEILGKHLGLLSEIHAHVVFTADQLASMTDAQLDKVESAHVLLGEVKKELGKSENQ